MWPFAPKTLRSTAYSVPSQLEIRSYSLPEMIPHWQLFAMPDDEWDVDSAIRHGYQASAIVYAAVEKRARLIASVPWHAQRLVDGVWTHEPLSPLQMLIDNPNPDTSWAEMMHGISQSLDLSGNAYVSEVKPAGRRGPAAIWLLPSQYVYIKPGREKLIDYYEYTEGTKHRIPSADMIHLKLPNPSSRYFGMPVLMGAARPVDVDRETAEWQKSSLQNRGVVDLHIQVPDTLTAEQRQEIRDKMRERTSGPDNARAPIVSSGSVTNIGMTAVEMDFVASRRAVWTEIAAAFGISLSVLGFTEDVNLANGETMMRQIWTDTILPQLDIIKRQLTQQLAREYGREWRLEPDLTNVAALRESMADRLKQAETMQRLGYTRNEINERLELGMPDDSSGDQRHQPMGLVRIDANDATRDDVRRVGYG